MNWYNAYADAGTCMVWYRRINTVANSHLSGLTHGADNWT